MFVPLKKYRSWDHLKGAGWCRYKDLDKEGKEVRNAPRGSKAYHSGRSMSKKRGIGGAGRNARNVSAGTGSLCVAADLNRMTETRGTAESQYSRGFAMVHRFGSQMRAQSGTSRWLAGARKMRKGGGRTVLEGC